MKKSKATKCVATIEEASAKTEGLSAKGKRKAAPASNRAIDIADFVEAEGPPKAEMRLCKKSGKDTKQDGAELEDPETGTGHETWESYPPENATKTTEETVAEDTQGHLLGAKPTGVPDHFTFEEVDGRSVDESSSEGCFGSAKKMVKRTVQPIVERVSPRARAQRKSARIAKNEAGLETNKYVESTLAARSVNAKSVTVTTNEAMGISHNPKAPSRRNPPRKASKTTTSRGISGQTTTGKKAKGLNGKDAEEPSQPDAKPKKDSTKRGAPKKKRGGPK